MQRLSGFVAFESHSLRFDPRASEGAENTTSRFPFPTSSLMLLHLMHACLRSSVWPQHLGRELELNQVGFGWISVPRHISGKYKSSIIPDFVRLLSLERFRNAMKSGGKNPQKTRHVKSWVRSEKHKNGVFFFFLGLLCFFLCKTLLLLHVLSRSPRLYFELLWDFF